MSSVVKWVVSAFAGLWLLDVALSFFAGLFVMVGGLVIATGAVAWARGSNIDDFWEDASRLQKALILIGVFAPLGGFLDARYSQVIINDTLGISIVHWFGFWGAVAGIVLFYYRTEYQGEQIYLQRREQIDGRFNAAVTLFNSEKRSARIGAIYSLYHLAVEDEKYRQEVGQILCSHIRAKTQSAKYQKEHRLQPSAEIQTAIDLLFRDVNGIKGLYSNPQIADDLYIADLSNSYLVGADFSEAVLRWAGFDAVKCRGANFSMAQCQGVSFEGAECQTADFEEAKCQHASFSNAQCQETDFYKAQCQVANFVEAQCQGAIFQNARCQGINFKKALCHGAYFYYANFQGAFFDYAECQGADFSEADFKGAYAKDIGVKSSALDEEAKYFSERVGEQTEFETVIFSGELTPENIQKIEQAKEFLSDDWWDEMQNIIKANKGKPISFDMPKDSGMITGFLENSEEIQEIIAEAEEINASPEQPD